MQYNLLINEEQREIITKALEQYRDHGGPKSDEEFNETELLCGMFEELPELEQKDPGIIHGLCL